MQTALYVLIAGATLFLGVFYSKTNAAISGFGFALGGAFLSVLASKEIFYGRGLTVPLLLARTVFAFSKVRVSISYLFRITVDGRFLLIRGSRIKSQFQPVGGVYKIRFDETELLRRFHARPDTRFSPDHISKGDLRLRLDGRHLPALISWFEKATDREILPTREFYEELIEPGFLPPSTFPHFDCSYRSRRTFGVEYDRHSECRQIIIADVYDLLPTEAQFGALRDLMKRVERGEVKDVYFASSDEMIRGAADGSFEIARTCTWITE